MAFRSSLMIKKKLISLLFILLSFFFLSTNLLYPAGIPIKFENEMALHYALENLPQQGVLKNKEGFIYLKVDDNYIYSLFALLEQKGLEIPPYFRTESAPGAHISVIYEDERQALPPMIPEVGQTFNFEIKEFQSIFLRDDKEVYVLVVSSPELEALRTKYGLSSKLMGHEYHITIAEKNYPANQMIMKELRFWYNKKWVEFQQRTNSKGDWGLKPYTQEKGLADDYKHLTRKDLRYWWNTRVPNYYKVCEGFEDDETPVTKDFLDHWFKIVSPNGWTP